jgi:hypothetical protein
MEVVINSPCFFFAHKKAIDLMVVSERTRSLVQRKYMNREEFYVFFGEQRLRNAPTNVSLCKAASDDPAVFICLFDEQRHRVWSELCS